MFQPGDRIGGMNVTTGMQDAAPLWAFCSPAHYIEYATPTDSIVAIIPRMAIGYIIMPENDLLRRLNWSEISWKLMIDGKSIDVNSFGTYNFAPARVDVCIR